MTPFARFIKHYVGKYDLVGAEVGVRDGTHAGELLGCLPIKILFLVDNFPSYDDDARIYTDDDQRQEYKKLLTMVLSSPANYWRSVLIGKSSIEAQKVFLNFVDFDFVYLDADHSLESVKQDLGWWDLVKQGGVLGGHDYGEHWGRFVKTAVDDFASKNNLELNVLDKARGGVEWAIIKK